MAEKEITLEIKNPEVIVLLIFCSIILFSELGVTFSRPVNFGDESYHAAITKYMVENLEYPVWQPYENTNLVKYSFNRPPLLHLLTASLSLFFGNVDFWVRFVPPFFSFLTGVLIYLLIRRIYSPRVGLIAGAITIGIPSLVTYATLFYTDVLLTFFTSFSILSFLVFKKTNSKKYLVLSASMGCFAFLSKAPGMAIYFFFGLALLYEIIRKKFYVIRDYLLIFAILFLLPAGYFIRNYYYFHTPSCYVPPLIGKMLIDTSGCAINNFNPQHKFSGRTEQVGTEQSVWRMGIMNYLNFTYGNVWFVILTFICGLTLLVLKKDETSLFLLLYFLFFLILFPFIVSRAEDTARYTLGWVFVFGVVSAIYIEEIMKFLEKYNKYLILIVIILVLYLSYLNFNGKNQIMATVKRFSPSFFEACNWVRNNLPKDVKLMSIWSHRVLYNCERDAVGQIPDIALSRDLNYTLKTIKDLGITHIYIQKFSIDPYNRHLGEKYDASFVQFLEDHPEHFKVVYENGPSLNITNRNLDNYIRYCINNFGSVCDGNIIYEVVL